MFMFVVCLLFSCCPLRLLVVQALNEDYLCILVFFSLVDNR